MAGQGGLGVKIPNTKRGTKREGNPLADKGLVVTRLGGSQYYPRSLAHAYLDLAGKYGGSERHRPFQE